MYGNKRPRGEDWGNAQAGRAGYPGGGSWGSDQMYGGAMDPSARDYGHGAAGAAMSGAGGAGMMSANGGGSAAGMMAGMNGMPGGMGASMSSGMGGGAAGMMMGQGGGMGMMAGSGMAGAGMMQQSGMGAASPMMGGGSMGSGAMGSMGGGMAGGQMGGMGAMGGMGSGAMGGMGGGGMGSMLGNHMGGGGGGSMSMMGAKGGMMPQHGAGAAGGGGYEGGMGVFPAVRLRGLPFGVREDEVRAFLGCDAVDVLLTRKSGRPSGEAFVVLGTPFQVEGALQRNKSYLGRRYVEVFSAHKHEYYAAVAQYMVEGGDGVPQQHYGGGGRGMYDGRSDHRRDGEDDQRRDHGRHRGDAPPLQQPHGGGGDQPAQHTGMLKLRGLPFSCTKADIMEWFTDLPVAPIAADGVRIVINADGRPSGMAFVEFASPEDAATAMAKDRKMLGNRYVELFPSSRDEATMDRGSRR